MKKVLITSFLTMLIFGFVAFGGASWGGTYTGISSSNKVFAPQFLTNTFSLNAQARFYPTTIFRANYQPVGRLNWGAGFRWNFFDP